MAANIFLVVAAWSGMPTNIPISPLKLQRQWIIHEPGHNQTFKHLSISFLANLVNKIHSLPQQMSIVVLQVLQGLKANAKISITITISNPNPKPNRNLNYNWILLLTLVCSSVRQTHWISPKFNWAFKDALTRATGSGEITAENAAPSGGQHEFRAQIAPVRMEWECFKLENVFCQDLSHSLCLSLRVLGDKDNLLSSCLSQRVLFDWQFRLQQQHQQNQD